MGSEIQTQYAHAQAVTVVVQYRSGNEVKVTHRFARNGAIVRFRTRAGELIEYDAREKTPVDLFKWIENRLNNETNLKNKVLKIREIID